MKHETRLHRTLTLFPATTIVIGAVVGSGIFVSSASMSRQLGSGLLLLGVWLFAGVMSYFGAVTHCELTGQMPRTGGLYEYLKVIYGKPMAFFYGWANFVIAATGGISGLAFVFGKFFGQFVDLPHLSPELEAWGFTLPGLGIFHPFADMGTKMVGALAIIILTVVNIRGVRLGATLQSLSTTAKILAIIMILGVSLWAGFDQGSWANLTSMTPVGHSLQGWSLVGAVGMALSGAFWAYDGWGSVACVADEVKDPAKTLPRAILLGSCCFTLLYLLINIAYLYILPVESIASASEDRVASAVVFSVLGKTGASLVAALIVLSTFDTINVGILTSARIYHAMGEDAIAPARLRSIHEHFRTPHISLVLQAVWALGLLFTGTFELITSMYVFINWLIYVLMAIGLFLMRWRYPEGPRPFEVPAYPWVPLIFIVFSTGYLLLTLITDIQAYQAGTEPVVKSVMGLVLVLSGAPLYYWLQRDKRFRTMAQEAS